MSTRNSGLVRDCMRTEVTEVDGKLDVLSALKVMKKVGATRPATTRHRVVMQV